MPTTWEGQVDFATTLPDVEVSTSYGTPALKVAGNLMARLRTEDDGGLALRCTLEDKQALLAADGLTFYTTPHYDNAAMILVNLDLVERDELLELVDGAWHIAASARARRGS